MQVRLALLALPTGSARLAVPALRARLPAWQVQELPALERLLADPSFRTLQARAVREPL